MQFLNGWKLVTKTLAQTNECGSLFTNLQLVFVVNFIAANYCSLAVGKLSLFWFENFLCNGLLLNCSSLFTWLMIVNLSIFFILYYFDFSFLG